MENLRKFIKKKNKQEFFKICKCGREFNVISTYYYHRKRCIGEEALHAYLKLPQKVDTEVETYGDKAYQCYYCDVTFSTIYYLAKHDKICRKKINAVIAPEHVCPLCGKCFVTRQSLIVHVNIHQEEKPYVCELCNMKFKLLPSLRSHVMIHMGDKLWECKVCKKSFKQRQALNVHKKIHTDNKPFICPHCGKRVTRLESLKSHIRIHTGEKPYKCVNCERTFTHGKQLRLHRPKCSIFMNIDDVIQNSNEDEIMIEDSDEESVM